MKKKTKDWIKENLINYLNKHELTISTSSWNSKKGIGSRGYSFKNHYDSDVDEYISTKFHMQCEEDQTKQFFNYLVEKKHGSEDMLLEFFKSKSPLNKTKVNSNGEVQIQDSSNDHYAYQKYMASFLKDQNMLFDYVGNLKFLGSEQALSFDLIKNTFNQEKKEVLIEMYLNSSLIKNTEFERKIYELVTSLDLTDKYIEFFPNLKEGKRDFLLNDFKNKKTESFIITFDKETLVKQIEIDKSMEGVMNNINSMLNLKKIPELQIEKMTIINGTNDKTVIILGDDLNIDYIKVAITEYMRIVLKENDDNEIINKFVNAPTNFEDEDKSWYKDARLAFIDFKERIQKIQLKERLDRNLVKGDVVKNKAKKI